jgi:hypothetical protein
MFLRVYATKVSMDIDIFCDSKGTTIQCKNKVERTKKRKMTIKTYVTSSTFQRNHGGEALLQQRNKQITNNKQTQQTIIIPCQDLKDPRSNKLI